MVCTGTDKNRIQPFLPQRYWQAGQKSKCLPSSCLEQPEPWQSMQDLAADVRTDSLGSLVLLCCFGASWRCHKWFSLISQSDATTVRVVGINDQSGGQCKYLPVISISPKKCGLSLYLTDAHISLLTIYLFQTRSYLFGTCTMRTQNIPAGLWH